MECKNLQCKLVFHVAFSEDASGKKRSVSEFQSGRRSKNRYVLPRRHIGAVLSALESLDRLHGGSFVEPHFSRRQHRVH